MQSIIQIYFIFSLDLGHSIEVCFKLTFQIEV